MTNLEPIEGSTEKPNKIVFSAEKERKIVCLLSSAIERFEWCHFNPCQIFMGQGKSLLLLECCFIRDITSDMGEIG